MARQLTGMVGEAGAPVVRFLQLELLDHGPHGAVEEDDALTQEGLKALAGRVQWESLQGHRPYRAVPRPWVKARSGHKARLGGREVGLLATRQVLGAVEDDPLTLELLVVPKQGAEF